MSSASMLLFYRYLQCTDQKWHFKSSRFAAEGSTGFDICESTQSFRRD